MRPLRNLDHAICGAAVQGIICKLHECLGEEPSVGVWPDCAFSQATFAAANTLLDARSKSASPDNQRLFSQWRTELQSLRENPGVLGQVIVLSMEEEYGRWGTGVLATCAEELCLCVRHIAEPIARYDRDYSTVQTIPMQNRLSSYIRAIAPSALQQRSVAYPQDGVSQCISAHVLKIDAAAGPLWQIDVTGPSLWYVSSAWCEPTAAAERTDTRIIARYPCELIIWCTGEIRWDRPVWLHLEGGLASISLPLTWSEAVCAPVRQSRRSGEGMSYERTLHWSCLPVRSLLKQSLLRSESAYTTHVIFELSEAHCEGAGPSYRSLHDSFTKLFTEGARPDNDGAFIERKLLPMIDSLHSKYALCRPTGLHLICALLIG
jgi:hypothetical protein